jgi:hypothetical protein
MTFSSLQPDPSCNAGSEAAFRSACKFPFASGRAWKSDGTAHQVGAFFDREEKERRSLPKVNGSPHAEASAKAGGAGDGNRTHDIQLGKLSFYH